jgi:glycosyltransferase involved in cell wall biosynthesis
MDYKTPIVSFLIPTKNRVYKLSQALNSLFNTCYDSHNFEVLCGVDKDDSQTISFLKEYSITHPNVKYYEFSERGYENIYKITNNLASKASGNFLATYTDDAIYTSLNWDLVIKEHLNKFVVFNPLVTKLEHYVRGTTPGLPGYMYCLLPIVPKKLFEIIGRLGNNTAIDSWISELVYQAKIPYLQEDNIILSLRETNNPEDIDDLYYKVENRKQIVKNDFFSDYQTQERIRDIEKIKQYLNSFG